MSRAAKPKDNGEPTDHKIQVKQSHVDWLKVQKAMRANGLRTASALCGLLLSKEYERLGITDELVLAEEKSAAKRPAKKVSRS